MRLFKETENRDFLLTKQENLEDDIEELEGEIEEKRREWQEIEDSLYPDKMVLLGDVKLRWDAFITWVDSRCGGAVRELVRLLGDGVWVDNRNDELAIIEIEWNAFDLEYWKIESGKNPEFT